nr:trypsin alpha-4-like [Penaeus vannamei]
MASQTLLGVLTVAMMGACLPSSASAPQRLAPFVSKSLWVPFCHQGTFFDQLSKTITAIRLDSYGVWFFEPRVNGSLPFVIEPRVNFDDTCRCGQKAASRIVGGVTTGVNEWPWQAALMYGSQQFCGGSLINDRYVLTAAHCTESMRASDLTPSGRTQAEHFLRDQCCERHTVLPVCMPPPNPTYAGKTACHRWGTTSSGGSSSDTLREVDVTVSTRTRVLQLNSGYEVTL